MDEHTPNTPGFGGYVVMFLVSLLVAPTAFVVGGVLLSGGDDGLGILAIWPIVAIYQLIFAIPLAAVGLPVIHLLCRRARAQWVHVLVAGLVPGALLVAFLVVGPGIGSLDSEGLGLLAMIGVPAGIGSAAGRAGVIGLVRRRRPPLPVPPGTPAPWPPRLPPAHPPAG